ncbi:hypothetical protein DBR43_09615 [Pedobacter sp. KBW06]|uniref:TlpA family protein disulfide reductase n=1 Tax=Pedobacter sp. KBW06 TaxID=2153359 RepID=UPI000F5999D3|nr:TlpA disulfide reductase family protein [Pedobacter sp. KBW06]RQO75584.1 hypothetical protein DBR43_09615 [Pedobacter sp. KBW06]
MKYIFILMIGLLFHLNTIGQTISNKKKTSLIPHHEVPSGKIKTGAKIQVFIEGATANDSLILKFHQNVVSPSHLAFTPHFKKVVRADKDGFFKFDIPVSDKPGYISLLKDKFEFPDHLPLLNLFLIEPGDNITLKMRKEAPTSLKSQYEGCFNDEYFVWLNKYRDFNYKFSGIGSEKFKARYAIDVSCSMMDSDYDTDYRLRNSLTLLEIYKERMSAKAYHLLKADLFGKYKFNVMENLLYIGRASTSMRKLSPEKKIKKMNADELIAAVADEELAISAYYPEYLLMKEHYKRDSVLKNSGISMYKQIKNSYGNELQQRLITTHFLNSSSNSKTTQTDLPDALTIVKDPIYRQILQDCYKAVKPNSSAPEFEFMNEKNQPVKLSDFRGKVVLIDFWFTGCTGCALLYKHKISHLEEKYKNNKDLVFVSISADRDHKTWNKGLQSGNYTSALAVNLLVGEKGLFHPTLYDFGIRGGLPHLTLIDKDGKILNNTLGTATKEELTDQIEIALSKK